VAERVCECAHPDWWERFERELRLPLEAPDGTGAPLGPGAREVVRGHGSVAATIAGLLGGEGEVLAVCADASRRGRLADLARFAPGEPPSLCERCGGIAVDSVKRPALTDYAELERAPELAAEFVHVVLVDPPSSALRERLAARPLGAWSGDGEAGFLHLAWESEGAAAALGALEEQLARRPALIGVYRELREVGEASGEELMTALEGAGPRRLGPEAAARCFRVLDELGLVRGATSAGEGTVSVVSSERTDLERSAAYRAYGARHQEGLRYLERRKNP
jgi:hypothetical protein